jgi:hypothetical protein
LLDFVHFLSPLFSFEKNFIAFIIRSCPLPRKAADGFSCFFSIVLFVNFLSVPLDLLIQRQRGKRPAAHHRHPFLYYAISYAGQYQAARHQGHGQWIHIGRRIKKNVAITLLSIPVMATRLFIAVAQFLSRLAHFSIEKYNKFK